MKDEKITLLEIIQCLLKKGKVIQEIAEELSSQGKKVTGGDIVQILKKHVQSEKQHEKQHECWEEMLWGENNKESK